MGKLLDLTGQAFNRLTVIERADNNLNGKVMWNCICICGNYKSVSSHSLYVGKTKSCGCLRKEVTAKNNYSNKLKNLTGIRFGKLVVLSIDKKVGKH